MLRSITLDPSGFAFEIGTDPDHAEADLIPLSEGRSAQSQVRQIADNLLRQITPKVTYESCSTGSKTALYAATRPLPPQVHTAASPSEALRRRPS